MKTKPNEQNKEKKNQKINNIKVTMWSKNKPTKKK